MNMMAIIDIVAIIDTKNSLPIYLSIEYCSISISVSFTVALENKMVTKGVIMINTMPMNISDIPMVTSLFIAE